MKFLINNKEFHTRKCLLSDFDFMYRIASTTLFPYIRRYKEPTKKVFTQHYIDTYKLIQVIMRGKRRIGYFQIRHCKTHTEINRIFFSPVYQGKGLGKFFMLHFEQLAKIKGYKKTKLQCWENNPACKFYKKLGYKKIKIKDHKVHFEKNI